MKGECGHLLDLQTCWAKGLSKDSGSQQEAKTVRGSKEESTVVDGVHWTCGQRRSTKVNGGQRRSTRSTKVNEGQ